MNCQPKGRKTIFFFFALQVACEQDGLGGNCRIIEQHRDKYFLQVGLEVLLLFTNSPFP